MQDKRKNRKEETNMDMKELIAKVADGKDLTEEEARRGMEILLGGEAT